MEIETLSKPIEIAGDGIVIRKFLPGDAPAMHEAIAESGKELSTTMGWWHEGFSLSETEEWATLCQTFWDEGKHYAFSILEMSTGAYLGSCALEGINRFALSANLSYWIRTSQTGRGIASQTSRLLAKWACGTLGMQRIEIMVVTSNIASQHVALKAGATHEGVLRNRLRVESRQYDGAMFSFIPADFADDRADDKPE